MANVAEEMTKDKLIVDICELPKKYKETVAADALKIREEFEGISKKALETPRDTAHLFELKEYVDKAKTKIVPKLMDRVAASKGHMDFLLATTKVTSSEINENAGPLMHIVRNWKKHAVINHVERELKKNNCNIILC